MLYFPSASENFSPSALASLYFTDRFLFSIYPFIMKKRPLSLIPYVQELFPNKVMMIDSGIYSIMHSKKDISVDTLERYTHKYVKMLLHINYKETFIEVDSQLIEKVPGTYKILRGIYDSYGVSNQVIYVWHFNEGIEALFNLMEEHKRIALSPKEVSIALKALNQNDRYKSFTKSLYSKIMEKSDGHHIHLLGTLMDWLAYLPHNWTCDSATWTSGLVWGYYLLGSPFGFDFRNGKESVSSAILSKVETVMPKLLEIYNNAPRLNKGNKNRLEFMRKLCICMVSMLEWWESKTVKQFGEYPKPKDPKEFKLF